jgi:hypothetical protein
LVLIYTKAGKNFCQQDVLQVSVHTACRAFQIWRIKPVAQIDLSFWGGCSPLDMRCPTELSTTRAYSIPDQDTHPGGSDRYLIRELRLRLDWRSSMTGNQVVLQGSVLSACRALQIRTSELDARIAISFGNYVCILMCDQLCLASRSFSRDQYSARVAHSRSGQPNWRIGEISQFRSCSFLYSSSGVFPSGEVPVIICLLYCSGSCVDLV